ncbi:cyanophycin synthetase [Nitrosomonas sp.]|jgi:cyanophycin synthetase|uniref:cyanophycin synthetase n=1 Tax=Nitrosomonas sp. TaxID=42353 RepID=UPI0025E20D2C|nr:cyanophycin synthetase [Nitrosomonas sp.]MBS0587374.1 cyanophycin synthetase [Pseudomonadota bacterium]MBV6448439.1 Cyanophycin synthetase [Nitrosomonas sp.]
MKVLRMRTLRGPNLWSQHTSIEATVFCGGFESNIDSIPGFEARLRERFPEISLLQTAGHHEAVTIAHVLEFATLGLQVQAGCPVTFSRTVQTPEADTYRVIVGYSEEKVGRLAFDLAQVLCISAIEDTAFDLTSALCRLRELNEDIRLGPSTGSIVQAAIARGIPFRRLTEGSLVQFGWGSKQRRIQASESDRTSAVAESIVQDKELTKTLLHAAGIPVPRGREVTDADDAWAAACEIGVPVVIKPQDSNQGKGVTVNLVTAEQVKAAFMIAAEISDNVLVERYIPGHDYRLLVVGNKLVAAARRDPPQVIGDGVHSIFELVEQINRDPMRGEGHVSSLTKIHLDEISLAYLAAQGLTAESVPVKGMRVVLRKNANLSTGGTATDVTDDVHPELAARAIAAAKVVGLDICGIDVVCDNVMNSLEDQGGGIIEVNAAPGLRMHLQPSYGKGRAVGEAIIDYMFPQGEDARIPVIAVTGTNGKTTTTRVIANILQKDHKRVGVTCTDGVYVDGQCIDTGDCSGPKSARNILFHPDVDAAVLETARGGLLREGLGFDRCHVAVVTNIGMGDHLGMAYINTVEELAVVKRVIVQNVTPGTGFAVLNAADPLVASMADHCPGSVIFFAHDKHHPVLAMHRAQHKRAIFVESGCIVAAGETGEYRIPLKEIPLTKNGSINFQIENVMAAIGAGWALGLEWKVIHAGVSSFVSDTQTAPGRFNLFNYRNATLIADYGHNPDAIQALVSAIDNIPSKKRSVVISAAGDRRDEDIRQQTRILGDAFDEVVLYQDQCQRGRADGEVLTLLREGLGNAKRTQKISEIIGESIAIDAALSNLQDGELCLILVDQVEQSLGQINSRIALG